MYIVYRLSLIFILILLPETAFAGWFENYTSLQDKSIQYLGNIFGTVGGLNGDGNNLFGDLFYIFNNIIFILGSIVLSYTTIMSMVNTASEGEAMGKKFSSIWIPIRSVSGMALLAPLPSGYSTIQALMMWIVIQGVGAANQLWLTILKNVERGVSISQEASGPSAAEKNTNVQKFADLVFMSMLCKNYLNMTQSANIYYYPVPATGNNSYSTTINVGTNDILNPTYQNICGSFTLSPPAGSDPAMVNGALDAILNSLNTADAYIATALDPLLEQVSDSSKGFVSDPDNKLPTFSSSMPKELKNQIINTYYNSIPSSFTSELSKNSNSINADAERNGWLFLGVYYYKLVTPSTTTAPQTIAAINPVATAPYNWPTVPTKPYMYMSNSDTNDIQAKLNGYLTAYYTIVPASSSASDSKAASVNFTCSNSGIFIISDIMNGTCAAFTVMVKDFMNKITDTTGDPLMNMKAMGLRLMDASEVTLFAIIGVFGTVSLLALMKGTAPTGATVINVLSMMTILMGSLLSLLWSAGATLAFYVPLIPFLLFLFGGIGWIIAVIETMIAAPLAALGLASPKGHEHLGSAAPSVMLVTNVFLRPSLMVIGFLASSKLFLVAIKMLNFSFIATLYATGIANHLGLFSAVAVIILYGGLAIILVNKSFSLIHHIPDKILRWIGGQAEQFGESSKADLDKTEQTANKGIEAGTTALKATASFAGEMMQKSAERIIEKNKEKEKEKPAAANPLSGNSGGGGGTGGTGNDGDGGGGGGGGTGVKTDGGTTGTPKSTPPDGPPDGPPDESPDGPPVEPTK
jgi:conjugal transfer/type IV secretion protein DotA/TraY